MSTVVELYRCRPGDKETPDDREIDGLRVETMTRAVRGERDSNVHGNGPSFGLYTPARLFLTLALELSRSLPKSRALQVRLHL